MQSKPGLRERRDGGAWSARLVCAGTTHVWTRRSRAVQGLNGANAGIGLCPLPDEYGLADLTAELPLRLVQYIDLRDLYYAVLQVRSRTLKPDPDWSGLSSGV